MKYKTLYVALALAFLAMLIGSYMQDLLVLASGIMAMLTICCFFAWKLIGGTY